MPRGLSSLFLAAIAACGTEGPPAAPDAGAEPDAGREPDGAVCGLPSHPDDLQASRSDGAELSGDVRRLVTTDDFVVACGEGFVATLDLARASPRELALDSQCRTLAVQGERAVAVLSSGEVVLLAIAPDRAPSLLDRAAAGAFDAAFAGARLFVAAGTRGLLAYSTDADALAPGGEIDGASDARAVLALNEGVLDFEASGEVRLLDASGEGAVATLEGEGAPLRVVSKGARVAVARGADGTDLFDVRDGTIERLGVVPTRGVAVDVGLRGEDLFVAEGAELVRWRVGDEPLASFVSEEERAEVGERSGAWIRAVALGELDTVVAEGPRVFPVTVGEGTPAPDLDLERTSAAAWAEPGAPTDGLFRVVNVGGGPLVLAAVDAGPPFSAALSDDLLAPDPRPSCPGQFVVPAKATFLVALGFAPVDAASVMGQFTLRSDDPDEAIRSVPLDGNVPAPAVGAPGADFALLTLTGDREVLSEHRGRVVLVKLFDYG